MHVALSAVTTVCSGGTIVRASIAVSEVATEMRLLTSAAVIFGYPLSTKSQIQTLQMTIRIVSSTETRSLCYARAKPF